MKVLNLYAGIGGNRKFWTDCEVTAVEIDEKIAGIYQDFYPDDKVIIGDAHEYLLKNYKDFDFIWASPPCPTHSEIRRCGVHKGQNEAKYPDMKLYQEIILLQHFAPKKTKWIVENVKPYYNLLIPGVKIERHMFWSNFQLSKPEDILTKEIIDDIKIDDTVYGYNLSQYKMTSRGKVRILRNLVNPSLGGYFFNLAKNNSYEEPTEQIKMFG